MQKISAIQKKIPVPLFVPEELTPGLVTFGFSFLGLFSASLVAKDRSGSLLARLRATPMTAGDFYFGYLLPLIPMAVCQMIITYAAALLCGLSWSWRIFPAMLVQMPMAVVFLTLGIVCGCLLTERQASGICGALLTNLSAWLSGAWFDLRLVGGVFERAAYVLPFANATDAGRLVLTGAGVGWQKPFLITCAYAVVLLGLAAVTCRKLAYAE